MTRSRQPDTKEDSLPRKVAADFFRELQWLNSTIALLLELLDMYERLNLEPSAGIRQFPTTICEMLSDALLDFLKGVEMSLPEPSCDLVDVVERFQKIDMSIETAIANPIDRDDFIEQLRKAEAEKYEFLSWLPDTLGNAFRILYLELRDADISLERLMSEVNSRDSDVTNDDRIVRYISKSIEHLEAFADFIRDHVGSHSKTAGIISDLDLLKQRIDNQDLKFPDDSQAIIDFCLEIKNRKFELIEEIGAVFCGRNIIEWYRKLFNLDFYLKNAIDMWQGGDRDWSEEKAVELARVAEAAKYDLIRVFPRFLDCDFDWWYRKMRAMQSHCLAVKSLLGQGDINGARVSLGSLLEEKHELEDCLSSAQ